MKESNLHQRSAHRDGYDFEKLCLVHPDLKPFVFVNEFQTATINFFDPEAVKALNCALLKHHYHISFWDLPTGFLCPPIPGRAEYIHHIADLIKGKTIPSQIKVLDIGVGANCVYPIIGSQIYGWTFIGTDINPVAIKNAEKIKKENPNLSSKIELRLQENEDAIFHGVMGPRELWDITICNPPFHASEQEADMQALRKLKNLYGEKSPSKKLNFSGRSHELWCKGGELQFISNMIEESRDYAKQCFWFTTLVSQMDHLPILQKAIQESGAKQCVVIPMQHGNKQSRILAWSFLTNTQQKEWKIARWE
jgi:23S rRNA (adenine1618-N6)-methyltransferase